MSLRCKGVRTVWEKSRITDFAVKFRQPAIAACSRILSDCEGRRGGVGKRRGGRGRWREGREQVEGMAESRIGEGEQVAVEQGAGGMVRESKVEVISVRESKVAGW